MHHGSWRDVRVCLVPKSVEIAVCVLVPCRVFKAKGMGERAEYWEERTFAGG